MAGIATLLDSAKDQSKEATERLTLTSVGIPSDAVTWYQNERKSLGFDAPSPSGLVILGMVVAVLFMVAAQLMYTSILSVFYIMGRGFSGTLRTGREAIIFCVIVGIILSTLIYIFYVKSYIKSQNLNVGRQFALSLGVNEPFQTATPPANRLSANHTLQTIQSIAVKQAGYIGPSESDGNFDPETGILSAIKSGIRAFILQIDYLDNAKGAGFDEPNMPTLLYRNNAGELISNNGANIKKVAQMFATHAFSPEFNDTDKPLLLYLHFVRTPNSIRKPEEYVKFLAKVAQMLEPLHPNLVGTLPEGSFQRQQNEPGLLGLPLKNLEQKVVFFTNVDTSLFRNLGPLGMKQYETKADLDYYTNFRVYATERQAELGAATTVATGGIVPSAVVVPMKKILSSSPEDLDLLVASLKGKYVIVLPDQGPNPEKKDIEMALDQFGANMIALNLFGEEMPSLQKKLNVWKGEPFLHLKPKRFTV